jgi:hypothetical protein
VIIGLPFYLPVRQPAIKIADSVTCEVLEIRVRYRLVFGSIF